MLILNPIYIYNFNRKIYFETYPLIICSYYFYSTNYILLSVLLCFLKYTNNKKIKIKELTFTRSVLQYILNFSLFLGSNNAIFMPGYILSIFFQNRCISICINIFSAKYVFISFIAITEIVRTHQNIQNIQNKNNKSYKIIQIIRMIIALYLIHT